MRLAGVLLCFLLGPVQEPASKPALEFEMASIKLNSSGSGIASINSTPGRLTAQNYPLDKCLQIAFDVYADAQLSGPEWLNSQRFDIEARAAGPATRQELMQMFQSLLIKRFRVTFHTEIRRIAVFALVPAKGGMKLEKHDPSDPIPGQTMPHFAAELSNIRVLNLGRPVIDMTGFIGEFKRNLSFKVDTTDSLELQARLSVALAEKMGLKLESRKADVEVMVIDHIERLPTAD